MTPPTDPDAARLRRRAARSFAANRKQAAVERAELRWAAGEMLPFRITQALDGAGLFGPEVDTACGAAEPAVDEWEAGVRYPTFEQLLLLADITGHDPEWFFDRGSEVDIDIRDTTLWWHMTERQRQQWRPPIGEFTEHAIQSCVGTDEYDRTYLF
ncbi:MAG: transcriptional regulator with XRE-family HTH domain [Rhodococcus sp. (in: high G+C Gram-positive bacteria)]